MKTSEKVALVIALGLGFLAWFGLAGSCDGGGVAGFWGCGVFGALVGVGLGVVIINS